MKLLLSILTLMNVSAYGAWLCDGTSWYNERHSKWWEEPLEPKMGTTPGIFCDRGLDDTFIAQPTKSKIDDATLQERTPEDPIVLQAAICTTLHHGTKDKELK